MTKSKNFWAASALISLAVMVFAAYSIYGRVSANLPGETLEVHPVPMPPPQEEAVEEETEEKPGAQAETAEAPARQAADQNKTEPAKVKAVKTVFEYKDAKAKSVKLAGSFTSWKARPMTKKNGVWKAEVYILPGNYPYHFTVDGKKKLDPGKPKAPTGDSLVLVE
ncbi:MAG: glycogen-binding domain-containing protein [Elusimicrobiales bacterium]